MWSTLTTKGKKGGGARKLWSDGQIYGIDTANDFTGIYLPSNASIYIH